MFETIGSTWLLLVMFAVWKVVVMQWCGSCWWRERVVLAISYERHFFLFWQTMPLPILYEAKLNIYVSYTLLKDVLEWHQLVTHCYALQPDIRRSQTLNSWGATSFLIPSANTSFWCPALQVIWCLVGCFPTSQPESPGSSFAFLWHSLS